MRIFKYRFEIALYACHGSLQFVCDVLCELPFQYVLFAACVLQSFVDLDDALGDFAQFVVGESYEFFRFKRFVVVGAACECAQTVDVLVQAPCESVEDDGEQDD